MVVKPVHEAAAAATRAWLRRLDEEPAHLLEGLRGQATVAWVYLSSCLAVDLSICLSI